MYVDLPLRYPLVFNNEVSSMCGNYLDINSFASISLNEKTNSPEIRMRIDKNVLIMLKKDFVWKCILKRTNLECYPDKVNIANIINIKVREDGVWQIYTEKEGKKYLTMTIFEPVSVEKVGDDEYNFYPCDDITYIHALDTPGMCLTDEQYENSIRPNDRPDES